MARFFPLLLLVLFSCTIDAQSPTRLDVHQTEALLRSDPTVQLLDVRTPAEWQQTGTVEGARRINFNSPDFQAQVASLDKEKPVVVYCAAGGRSPRAAAVLVEMGFKKVFDFAGGMNEWKAAGKKKVQ